MQARRSALRESGSASTVHRYKRAHASVLDRESDNVQFVVRKATAREFMGTARFDAPIQHCLPLLYYLVIVSPHWLRRYGLRRLHQHLRLVSTKHGEALRRIRAMPCQLDIMQSICIQRRCPNRVELAMPVLFTDLAGFAACKVATAC